MKPEANQLIQFLDEHVSKKLYRIPKIRFSSHSRSLLITLLQLMHEAERSWDNAKAFVFDSLRWTTELPKGYMYDYCSQAVRTEIETMKSKRCIYTFEIENRTFQVAFLYSASKRKDVEFCHTSIKRIYCWLYVANRFAPAKCSQKMNIYLYLTSLKKNVPDSHGFIAENHANSAATTSCKKVTEIHLYREEEWYKVLIHETFHCLGLDFSEFDTTKTNRCILEMFPVKSDVRLFETYCEMWAEIMNVLFLSYSSTKKNILLENLSQQDITNMMRRLSSMLEKEQKFSLYQCAKVLHFYGLSYPELYLQTSGSQEKRLRQYKEDTHVLSYFIIKSIFMYYVDDFVSWCDIHNRHSINFKKDDGTIDSYCKLVRDHYKLPEFVHSQQILDAWFDQNHRKPNIQMELRTLRMSLHEV